MRLYNSMNILYMMIESIPLEKKKDKMVAAVKLTEDVMKYRL